MEHRSTIIRNVEIPSTLPPMQTLTKLTGSILLKEVEPEDDGIHIEGDLLWRGYFEENSEDCLWEGAEYFTETITGETLRKAESPIIEPEIISLDGAPLSEHSFRLTFDIRWYKQPEIPVLSEPKNDQTLIIPVESFTTDSEKDATRETVCKDALPEPVNETEIQQEEIKCELRDKPTENQHDAQDRIQEESSGENSEKKSEDIKITEHIASQTNQEPMECPCKEKEPQMKQEEKRAEISSPAEEAKPTKDADFAEKLESIEETWRETLKQPEPTPEPAMAAKPQSPDNRPQTETAPEIAPAASTEDTPCCPWSKYCLRFYRTQEGDALEEIAERFSATLAKLKEFNNMDSYEEGQVKSGRLLRIP